MVDSYGYYATTRCGWLAGSQPPAPERRVLSPLDLAGQKKNLHSRTHAREKDPCKRWQAAAAGRPLCALRLGGGPVLRRKSD